MTTREVLTTDKDPFKAIPHCTTRACRIVQDKTRVSLSCSGNVIFFIFLSCRATLVLSRNSTSSMLSCSGNDKFVDFWLTDQYFVPRQGNEIFSFPCRVFSLQSIVYWNFLSHAWMDTCLYEWTVTNVVKIIISPVTWYFGVIRRRTRWFFRRKNSQN